MVFFFSLFLLLFFFFLGIIGISKRVRKERATDDPYPRAQHHYLYMRSPNDPSLYKRLKILFLKRYKDGLTQ